MIEERTPKGSSRFLRSVDSETGEVMDGVAVWVGRKVRSPYGRRWMQVNQDATEVVAADKEIDGATLRVFLLLVARLDFENWIHVPQKDLGETLGMKAPNVSRAVKLLERKGIILRCPALNRASVWRLNPHYGWKGKVIKFHEAQRQSHLQLVKAAATAGQEAQQQAPADDRQMPLF